MRLAVTVALISGFASDLLLEGVELANALQRLVGQRTERVVLAFMDFVELSPAMADNPEAVKAIFEATFGVSATA